MPLVYGCIAPHGSEVVAELAGRSLKAFEKSRKGMKTLAADMKKARPEAIVIASPHNLRMPKHIGVVISENASGSVSEGKKTIELKTKCDVSLAAELVVAGEAKGLPVAAANFGALEGPLSDITLDWGSLIPLWFFLKKARLKAKVVIVTPARGIPLSMNFEFGRAIAEVAENSKKRIALVASSDQAHTHRKDGPYGFSPKAKVYDERVVSAVRDDRLASIMRMSEVLVEQAKPDSLWQMAMLAGAISLVPFRGTLVSYEAPTYFGLLCASYVRFDR